MGATAAPGTAPRSEAYAAAIAAARRCFKRFGVDKTTMEDVAKEAGMARSWLYKTIATRQEVIEGAVLDRLSEIADEIGPLLARSPIWLTHWSPGRWRRPRLRAATPN